MWLRKHCKSKENVRTKQNNISAFGKQNYDLILILMDVIKLLFCIVYLLKETLREIQEWPLLSFISGSDFCIANSGHILGQHIITYTSCCCQ